MSSRGKELISPQLDKYDHKSFNGTAESRLAESRSDTFKKKCPLRVQNDWSEHISSKGLIYYYNCRTEVSQWQKPDEWTLSSMPHEDVKRLLTAKNRESNNNKRFYPNQSITDLNTSPKRIKYSNNNNNNNSNQTASIDKTSNYKLYPPKVPKIDQVKNSKSINTISNNLSGITANNNNNKIKANEANFNNDDMDISPGSSPLSRGSHSPTESDKKHTGFEQPLIYNRTAIILNSNKTQKIYNNKSWSVEQKLENSSPAVNQDSTVVNVNVSVNNPIKTIIPNQIITKPINKYSENQSNSNSNSHSLTQFQISLAASLRSTLNVLHSRSQFFSKDENSHSKPDNCLSVFHISDLLIRIEAVNNNGETANSYRSHRLQAQLSQNNNSFPYSNNNNSNNNNNNNNDHLKSNIKPSANITQIKELVKSLQDFIQENYPNSLSIITPVSPNYSKSSNRMSHYLQVLTNLIETCLMQLCPQSFNSPSSTSSPGSLKDNNSSVSTPGTSQSYAETTNKIDIDSPHKKESIEIDKPKSILQDIEMMKYVSSDVTNSYRNQLADFYVQEAQVEYYKFVRLHSVLYAELASESKKLKALVRISEINTDLLKQKKEDLEKLVQMLESRRLPNHLKCDYVPNS